MKQIIVIPARMSGTRLPGKPLIEIEGKSIIWRVWNQCRSVMSNDNIFVATEDQEILDHCNKYGINCQVTERSASAIDRIKLFSDVHKADSYLNIQGDEPIVNPLDIKTLLEYNIKYPKRVVFGKASASKKEFEDFSKAKVVCDLEGKLLYSSRAGIPVDNKGNFVKAERAIWLYAFNKKSLDDYYKNIDKTKLDNLEDNEILRFLELGIPVYCIDMIGDSWAVDEPKDLEIVKKLIQRSK